MKEWNLEMNKLLPKTLKSLVNELSREVGKWQTSQKNVICVS